MIALCVREEAEPPDLYGCPAGCVRGRRGVRGRGVEAEPGGPVHVRVVLLVQDQLLTVYFTICSDHNMTVVMTDLSCEAGEVVPLVPGSVAVVEAVLEDEVVPQLLVVAELAPTNHRSVF